jgi:Ca-activated chloride channel family protein
VRRSGDPAILATQPLGTKANYLAGSYDIEVLTLPVTRTEKIQLQSGSSSDLELPLPGQLAFDKPQEPTLGSIFVRKANGLQWVCDLDPASPTERIVLMPGAYALIIRPLKHPSSGAVRSAHFTIRSAQQTGLKASDLR